MFKKKQPKTIEARAFRDGTQGVSQADALRETEARFEMLREDESRRATDEIKALEADTNTLTQRKADAEERWLRMNALTNGREPEFAKPLLAVAVAFGLIFADGQLLAPVMDGLNITEPLAQLLVASVLVAAFSALLKISVHNYRQPQRKLWLVIAPAAFSLLALAVFGWWRGAEVVFAGQQSGDGSNTFAADNPILTRLFVTLATIALPVGAAILLEYGLEKLRRFNEWKKARGDFFKFSKALGQTQKKHEAAIAKRDHEREKLAQTREEWLSAARQAHTEGARVGAHKGPWRDVILKILWVGALIFAGVMIASYVVLDKPLANFIETDAARFALYLLVAFGLIGLYATSVMRRWNRPTAEELYEARPTHWRNAAHPDATNLNAPAEGRALNAGSVGDVLNEETVVEARG